MINVNNSSSGAAVSDVNAYMQDGNVVVDMILSDLDKGGPVSAGIQQTFGLGRKAQGAY